MSEVSRAESVVQALARELGLADAKPIIIADLSNLVLRVGPVVARVAMATSMARIGMAWLRREVELSRFLAARGVGVTRPIDGPFERDGLVISFWEEEHVLDTPPNSTVAGTMLREAHRALADYPGELPSWGGFEEARQVLERSRAQMTSQEQLTIDRAWEDAERIVEGARARSASFQPIHGDAHIGNVLSTRRGVLWTDWEDAFLGPVEFDLACIRSRADLFGEKVEAIEAMTAAYGAHDRNLVRDLGLVRNVQVIAWLGLFAERDPSRLPRMQLRLSKL